MRRLIPFLVLTLSLAAHADKIDPHELARQFLEKYRARDEVNQSILAAKKPTSVDYALVVYTLLQQGHTEAAKALVELRGEGPERKGLERLFKTLTAGTMPTPEEAAAWELAERQLSNKQPAQALEMLKRAGEPIEGTVLGANIRWTRARAFFLENRRQESGAEFAQCARYAESIGWLSRAREAQLLRQRIAPRGSDEALAATNGLVAVLKQLDDRPALLKAFAQRAGLYVSRRKAKEARTDYMEAIRLAESLKLPFVEAQLWNLLAHHFQTYEREPRSALKYYRKALELLRGLGKNAKADAQHALLQTLYNTSLVLTDIARYDEALETLGELLEQNAIPLPAAIGKLALKQRAYVLRRLGRVQASARAYEAALAATSAPGARRELVVDIGNLEALRGDLRAAERHFSAVLEKDPKHMGALTSRASVRARRGDRAAALEDFETALALAKGTAARGRLLLRRATARRGWGRITAARKDAADALKALLKGFEGEDRAQRDYGNTAVAYVLVGDLLLLDGLRKEAIPFVERAAAFFLRLKDVPRLIPAYARWTLTLIALEEPDETLQRFQVLNNFAQGTTDKSLKSIAKTVEAFIESRAGKPDDAQRLFREAAELGKAVGDVERQATALAYLALIDQNNAGAHLALALEVLDGARLNGPGLRPDLEGEHPGYAASIAVRLAKDAEPAFALMQRARGDRLLTALHGRARVLDSLLTPEQYARYVEARANLMEARARDQGVDEAETAFDAMVAGLRKTAPAAAALAFPRPVSVAMVQAALKPDEAMLCMLVDRYARRMVAITKQAAILREYNQDSPLAAFQKDLKGVRQLIVVPDGTLSIDLAAWGGGQALDAFGIAYVPSAAAFLRLRASNVVPGKGAARIGGGPDRLEKAAAGKRVRLLHIGTPLRIDLRHPAATDADLRRRYDADVVVFAGADVVRGRGRIDGLAAAAQAAILGGARQVILSLVGPPPNQLWNDFYANCLDRGMTPAFGLLQARRAIRKNDKKFWAGMVVWGVP